MTGKESNKIQLAGQDLVNLLFGRIGGLSVQEADQIKGEFQTILVGPDFDVSRCQKLLERVKACDCSPDAPIQIGLSALSFRVGVDEGRGDYEPFIKMLSFVFDELTVQEVQQVHDDTLKLKRSLEGMSPKTIAETIVGQVSLTRQLLKTAD